MNSSKHIGGCNFIDYFLKKRRAGPEYSIAGRVLALHVASLSITDILYGSLKTARS